MNKTSQWITIFVILIACVLLVLFWLNAPEDTAREPASTSTPTQATTTATSSDETDQTSRITPEVATTSTSTTRSDITVQTPQGSNSAAQAARNFIRQRQAEFQQFVSEQVSTSSSYQPTLTFDAQLDVYQTDSYISYLYTVNEYTGGAHANQSAHSFVADKTTDQPVSLSDVITGSPEQFMQNLQTNLYEVTGIDPDQDTGFAQTIGNLTLGDIDTFYVTDSEITVLFSKYEVAPGAAGIVAASVSR